MAPKWVQRRFWHRSRETNGLKTLFGPTFGPSLANGLETQLWPTQRISLRTKNSTERNFSTGSQFATAVAQNGTESARKCFFLWGRRGRKTVQRVKNYGGSKILRMRARYYFFGGIEMSFLWYRDGLSLLFGIEIPFLVSRFCILLFTI